MRIYNPNKNFYVYEYLRKDDSDNGKAETPYYIGKGSNDRAFSKNRLSKPPKDRNRIKFICENMNEADAFQLEMLLIWQFGRLDNKSGCLHNATDGGDGISGYKHSFETKLKQSNAAKNREPVSAKTRQRMSKRMKNLSLEEREKLSLPRKNRKLTKEHREKISAGLLGRVVSPKTRKKLSLAHLGKKPTKETIQKLSEAHIGVSNGKHSRETRNKISASVRKHWLSIKQIAPK